MAGRRFKKAKQAILDAAPPTSWIHKCHYSMGKPEEKIYFLCTPHGMITLHEEYACWIYAVTGNWNQAKRMVYTGHTRDGIKPKERGRVADLLDMDARGVIKLNEGPWKYYGYDIGDPSRINAKDIKDYGTCLMKPKEMTNPFTSLKPTPRQGR